MDPFLWRKVQPILRPSKTLDKHKMVWCEAGSDSFSSQKALRIYIHYDFHASEVQVSYTSLLDLCNVIQAECSLWM